MDLDLFDFAMEGLGSDPLVDILMGLVIPLDIIAKAERERYDYVRFVSKLQGLQPEGPFGFKHEQSITHEITEGSFNFKNQHLTSPGIVDPLIPKIITFGSGIYFGTGHTFGETILAIDFSSLLYAQPILSHQGIEEGSFLFDHFESKTTSKSGTFNYRRAS